MIPLQRLNILHATPELRGLAQVGGLAEVPLALARASHQAGHDARLIMPFYACLEDQRRLMAKPVLIWEGRLDVGDLPPAQVFSAAYRFMDAQLPLYLVKGHQQFEAATTPHRIYAPDADPRAYCFFGAAILAFLAESDWLPDVLHAHDYHAALATVYLHTLYGGQVAGHEMATVVTIHNLGHQGVADKEVLTYGGLPSHLGDFASETSMEFYGKINCLKGALTCADIASTVSRTYAREIQTQAHDKGLYGVLSDLSQRGRLVGITNGIDHRLWDPTRLAGDLAFSPANLAGKDRAKAGLRQMYGLPDSPEPLLLVMSRWAYQKGLELLLYALRLHELHRHMQVLVVAWGQTPAHAEYLGLWHELDGWWARQFPDRIAIQAGGTTERELHYAGSDLFLMPSLYEPCGLGQMEAMCYGAIPVVHSTGGLADTVTDAVGFGFDWSFHEPLDDTQKQEGARQMMQALGNALTHYQHRQSWRQRVVKAMQVDNGWANRLPAYEALYENAMTHAYSRRLVEV